MECAPVHLTRPRSSDWPHPAWGSKSLDPQRHPGMDTAAWSWSRAQQGFPSRPQVAPVLSEETDSSKTRQCRIRRFRSGSRFGSPGAVVLRITRHRATQPFYSLADPLADLVPIHKCPSPMLSAFFYIVAQAAPDRNSARERKHGWQSGFEQEQNCFTVQQTASRIHRSLG